MTKTDAQVQQDVIDELIDAQNISIDVRGADVTLTGTVHSWSEREFGEAFRLGDSRRAQRGGQADHRFMTPVFLRVAR